MRIAVWHNLPSGGGKRALHDHVKGLLALGHEVEAWCPPSADQIFLPLSPLIREHVIPMEQPRLSLAQRGVSFATDGFAAQLAELEALSEHTRTCATQIDGAGFDVVLGNSSMRYAVAPLARHLETPSVLYLQEPYRRLYEAAPVLPWRASDRRRSAVRDVLPRLREAAAVEVQRILVREETLSAGAYGRLLANSHFSREGMLRAYDLDARVCYLGIDTGRYHDHGLEREHMVVGIGQFSPHKRIDAAIRAVAAVPDPRPSLCWIGNVAEADHLGLLVDLARSCAVDFRPMVALDAGAVVEVLNQAKCLLYCPRLEPFGYAPLEGAGCGLPVVARAEGGVRETVVDGVTGLLVGSDDELGTALASLLSDPEALARMGAAGRAAVESRWSNQQAAHRLEGHLKAIARS